MNRNPIPSAQALVTSLLVGRGLAYLTLLLWFSTTAVSQTRSEADSSVTESTIHVTHVLGFEGARHSVKGELRIQGDALQFQQDGRPAAQVSIGSILNVALGEENKQVGGVPVMLGKTAVPFGGGRVVSLFSHKKYDTSTIEYLDSNGGFHGAIFSLTKGQGETFKKNLAAKGAHIASPVDQATTQSTPGEKNENKPSANTQDGSAQQWSVQVERVDPGDVGLESSFEAAIYENLLEELTRRKQFKQVFRSGDRKANDSPNLLRLKATVQKYTAGSETRRAVTTVSGATKLNVAIRLYTRDGHLVLQQAVDGEVRFFGDNMRATHNLAKNVAGILKKSTLPAFPV